MRAYVSWGRHLAYVGKVSARSCGAECREQLPVRCLSAQWADTLAQLECVADDFCLKHVRLTTW